MLRSEKLGEKTRPASRAERESGPFPLHQSTPSALLRSLIFFFRYFTPLLAFSPTIEPGSQATYIAYLNPLARSRLSLKII